MFAWLKRLFHKHDFEMTFPSGSHSLDWLFVCKCGRTTRSIVNATRQQGR